MDASSQFLLTIGGILLLGLFTSTLADRTFLPRVTFLLIFGAIIGKEALDIIPPVFTDHFEIIAEMALLMVAFLIGGKLTWTSLKVSSSQVFGISVSAALITAIVVCVGLMLVGVSVQIAIILGCIASATAPAAILDIVLESGKEGRFSKLLLAIVALDDIWALILFGISLAVAKSMNGVAGDSHILMTVIKELGGAVLLGLIIGLPAAYLTGRIKQGRPMISEALGLVFVCGGLALWLDVSYLVATMVMGMIIANLARHHEYPFHALENIESPFMVIFFVLAGASLEFRQLQDIGLIGAAFIVCRVAGKYLGAKLGGHLSHAPLVTRRWIGLALLPQAGVPIGMALVASNQFPEYRQLLLSVVISSTVLFDIIGPILTRKAIQEVDG